MKNCLGSLVHRKDILSRFISNEHLQLLQHFTIFAQNDKIFTNHLYNKVSCLSVCLSAPSWLYLWVDFKAKHIYRLLLTQGGWENYFHINNLRNKKFFNSNIIFQFVCLYVRTSVHMSVCMFENKSKCLFVCSNTHNFNNIQLIEATPTLLLPVD